MTEQAPLSSVLPPERQERVASYLRLLAPYPPYCLLLEGGTRQERERLALFWAALLNCSGRDRPCGRCPECVQLASGAFRELYWLWGEEGPVKIEEVRAFRRSMAEKMSLGSVRVFVVSEAQELTPSAANGLLKSLEEPLPGNVFLLLAPQRSLLLPTLVSRSYLFTLGWLPAQGAQGESVSIWMERLLTFWSSGEELFASTGKKGEVDRSTLLELIVALQSRLLQALLQESGDECVSLLQQRTGAEAKMRLHEGLNKAHWAVQHQVNPSLVLDWIALEVWSCLDTAGRS
jgi:DNA polymerase-3 subunit delta'